MKFTNAHTYPLFATYVLMLVALFVLPSYSAEGYDMVRHTSSELAAQRTPNAMLMNCLFIALGISSIAAGWKHLESNWLAKGLLVVFGVSLTLTAFFRHAPITEGMPFDRDADFWHSVLSSVTGWAFTFFCVAVGLIARSQFQAQLAIGVAIFAAMLSLLMFQVPAYAGIWQRLIFMVAFAWMVYAFNNYGWKTESV